MDGKVVLEYVVLVVGSWYTEPLLPTLAPLTRHHRKILAPTETCLCVISRATYLRADISVPCPVGASLLLIIHYITQPGVAGGPAVRAGQGRPERRRNTGVWDHFTARRSDLRA